MYWKENMNERDFRSSEFLMKKIADNLPRVGANFQLMYPNGSRGIPKPHCDDIIKKLCPLMKENRREFWYSLKTNDEIEYSDDDMCSNDAKKLKVKGSKKRVPKNKRH